MGVLSEINALLLDTQLSAARQAVELVAGNLEQGLQERAEFNGSCFREELAEQELDPATIQRIREEATRHALAYAPENYLQILEVMHIQAPRATEAIPPEPEAKPEPLPATPQKPKAKGVWTNDELLQADFPEPEYIVDGLVGPGLALFGGRPKAGKSTIGRQLTHAVAAGGMFLGHTVKAGPVLYAALEDNPRRIADRMRQQHCPLGLDIRWAFSDIFASEFGDLRNGGAERMARSIEKYGYRLVVIDTLSRATSSDPNEHWQMSAVLNPLQQLALSRNCTILIIDHLRKGSGLEDGDFTDDFLGSSAKTGSADVLLRLDRESGRAGSRLRAWGREIEPQDIAIHYDAETGVWQPSDPKERFAPIIEAMRDLGPSTPSAVAEAIGKDRSTAFRHLQDMFALGLVHKSEGKYSLS